MDKLFKITGTAAALMIIVCGIAFLRNERRAPEAEARVEQYRAALFQSAGAADNEVAKVMQWCQVRVYAARQTKDIESRTDAGRCIALGYAD